MRSTKRIDDARGSVGIGKRDNGAAEARSGEPCRKRAESETEIDESVELRCRDLEVVAQAPLAGCEKLAERAPIVAVKRLDGGQNALVLGLDVSYSAGVPSL
jgi:hypothetical protein